MAVLARPGESAATRRVHPWAVVAGTATVVAGGLHVVAAVQHADLLWIVPSFFTVVAALQIAAGLGLVRGLRRPLPVVAGVLAGSVGLVLLYLLVYGTDLLSGLTVHPAGHGQEHGGGHSGVGQWGSDGAAIQSTGSVSMGGVGEEEPVTGQAPAEDADAFGTAALVAQLVAVTAATALLPRVWQSRVTSALLVLALATVGLWLTGGLF